MTGSAAGFSEKAMNVSLTVAKDLFLILDKEDFHAQLISSIKLRTPTSDAIQIYHF